jgi:MYXO-CTERM domain-containing protein
VDVQLLGALDTNACLARNDSTFTQQVGCGTYYVVADTYGTDSSKAGPYTLSASFTPSGAACSAVPGPAPYNPKGKLGDACKFPKNQTLPYCNPNLGGDTCIYTSTDSFCSKPCATDNDCADMPGAKGCCKDLGQGEKYCLTAAVCGSGSTPGKDDGGAVGDPSTPSTPTDPNNPSNPSNPSNPANPADPGATPGEVTTTTTTSGCSSTPVTTTGSTTGIVFGLAGLGVAMWRRRRRGRPSLPPIALG